MINFGIISIVTFLIFMSFKIMNVKEKNHSIHYLYIVGILVSIIIVLITKNFGQNSSLVSYISFAATLASLLLAVIAIFHAIVSNNNVGEGISKISGASLDLTEKMKGISENIIGSVKELSDIKDEITKKFENQEQMIKDVDTKVCVIQEHSKELMIKAREPFELETKKIVPLELKSSDSADEEKRLEDFYTKSSLSGLMILYALKLSFQKTESYNLRDLSSKIGYMGFDYTFGFMVAVTAMEKIDFNLKNDIVTVKYVDPFIVKSINKKIHERAEIFDNELKQETGSAPIKPAVEEIEKIEKYFS